MKTIACEYCGEQILPNAKKCKHCGEFLNAHRHLAPQPVKVAKWSPGVAAVLSFLLPGVGQMYKGQVIRGFLWMIAIVIGYVPLIVPGLVLHLCCVLGASSGDPYK